MAPGNSKRKRPERQYSQEDGSGRPSPHRPENLHLGQQTQQEVRTTRGGSTRRSSRQTNNAPSSPSNGAPDASVSRKSKEPSAPPQAVLPDNAPKSETPKPSTPAQQIAAPARLSQDPAPSPPTMPYAYDHLTDEVLASWQDNGRPATLEAAKAENPLEVSILLQELVRSSLDGRMEPTEAGSFIKEMISLHQESETVDPQSLFLDTISLLEESYLQNRALPTLVAATGIDPDAIRHELDVPLLQSLQLVRNTFNQMRTRKTTNILYRQANFNLLREESEGYAKLITDYYNAAQDANAEGSDPEMAKDAFHRVMALVGAFDLDVGRVLDITLDISANSLVKSYRFLVKFYRCSSWWPDHNVLDNIRWHQDGPSSLPGWAIPSSNKWQHDDEDRELLATSRLERDVKFWQRLTEKGIDAFFELGARKIVDFDSALPLLEQEAQPEHDARGREINGDQRRRINENRKYMRETKMLPPPGNADAAQLLGLKLRFYASSARDVRDVLPENLIYLAALLIKIGFVSLRDLYPHLYPSDDGMSAERERLEKEKAEKERKERPGGGMNALLMAGALADDTIPAVRTLRADAARSGGTSPKPDKKEEDAAEELPPPSNQKLLLLKALLAIGALPEALYILGRFPWLMDVDTTLPPYFHRIANHMLSKIAETVRPLATREDLQDTKQQLSDTLVNADGSLSVTPRPKTKTRKWLGLDGPDNGDGFIERHYYTDWDDNIPVCQTVEDFFLLSNTFLNYLGVKVGQDSLLITTMIRLVKRSLLDDDSDASSARCLELMKRMLVPALSLTKHNPAITQEVHDLLILFPTTVRYSVYEEWYTGKTSRLPDVKVAFDRNRAEVKDVLRRITNESGKKQARALAKVTLASPGIVMMTFINQLESYSNMIPGLVDSVRYFSPLAYDILTWVLIRSLSGQGRDRMQGDGMLTSAWLQALSQFVASLFTRYVVVNPSPVLQYVASELRSGDSTDLELIDQVLAEMAGIRSDMNFNDAQVLAMTGGDVLQSQVVQQLADIRHQRKSSAKRLMRALSEPGITGQILISIAQERQMYPHREAAKYMPLKVLGNNLDKIQVVFAQYLDVLRSNLNPVDFEQAVPDVISLIGDFGIEPGTAFTVCRTAIAFRMAELDAIKKKQQEEEKEKEKEKERQKKLLGDEKATESGDTEMLASASVPTINGHTTSSEALAESPDHATELTAQSTDDSKVVGDSSERNNETAQSSQPVIVTPADNDKPPWHPVLEDLMARLPAVTGDLEARVSTSFFVAFWTLTPQDVHVPTESYQNEIQRLEQQIKEIGRDRSDLSAVATKERERRRRALQDLISQLTREVSNRVTTFTNMKIWLNTQKRHWFTRTNDGATKDARHLGLLQECFLPRAFMSSLDAHYCFMILKVMHNNGTPGFSMMHLLHQLMRKQLLGAIIFQCTAREAENFGRFLCEVLKQLAHWHSSKAVYDKEALGSQRQLPGFAIKFDEKWTPTVMLEYEGFRKLLLNWHTWLKDAFKACFESGEYMQIRNGIIVLKAIYTVYPALKTHGKEMQDRIKEISDKDSRGDLKLAALSLQGPLKSRERQWVLPQNFRLNDKDIKEDGKPESQDSPVPTGTPRSTDKSPGLNGAATEFKPGTTGVINGDARKGSLAGAEDGEIEDERQTAPKEDVKMEDVAAAEDAKAEQKQSDEKGAAVTTKALLGMDGNDSARTESKPATPAPIPAKPPPVTNGGLRAESGRTTPSQQNRTRRDLNTAPRQEVSLPTKPLPGPPGARSNHRPDDRYGRLDRPSDVRAPASRERSPGLRNRGRSSERGDPYGPAGHSRSYRDDPPSQRFPQAESRYARDDSRSRSNQPPATQTTRPDRAMHMRSEVAASSLAQDSRPSPSGQSPQVASNEPQTSINPQRAALMSDEPNNRDKGWEGKGRRRDWQNDRSGGHQDVRTNGRGPVSDGGRDAHQQRSDGPADNAPTGPRASRGLQAGRQDLFDQPSQRNGPVESGRGRLSRDTMPPPSTQADPGYGRLNESQDTTSSPRPPNGPSAGRGSRHSAAPYPALHTRASDSSLQTLATQRAPNPRHQHQRFSSTDQTDGSAQNERAVESNSVPTTPSAEAGPAMHPSRLANLGPPSIETNIAPSNGPKGTSSPNTAPPSGPRGHNRPPPGTPTGPSPVSNSPAGSGFGDRQRRSDRQRANINATLQQGPNSGGAAAPTGPATVAASSQGVSFRGAARLGGPDSGAGNGAAPEQPAAIASSMDAPSQRGLGTERGGGSARTGEGARQELFQRDARRRYEDERGDPRQRGSRNSSRERGAEDAMHRRPGPAGMEDNRQQRGPGRGDERRLRDDRDLRDAPLRDRQIRREDEGQFRRPPPDMPGTFGGSQPPPQPLALTSDWDNRGGRRDGPDDRGRGPRGPPRGTDDFRGMRTAEDERRDGGRGANRGDIGPPPFGPEGRKRRHDDAVPPYDNTKRRRSGR